MKTTLKFVTPIVAGTIGFFFGIVWLLNGTMNLIIILRLLLEVEDLKEFKRIKKEKGLPNITIWQTVRLLWILITCSSDEKKANIKIDKLIETSGRG